MDCSPSGSPVHEILQKRTLEWVAFPPPGDLPDPGIDPTSPAIPALQADSLPLCHWGSPTNQEMGQKIKVQTDTSNLIKVTSLHSSKSLNKIRR